MSRVQYDTVTCTPHVKPDAEKPWVTKESNKILHFWFDPRKTQTLLEAAEAIEAWAVCEYEKEKEQFKASIDNVPSCSGCCVAGVSDNEYHLTIIKMEIRGESYDREAMAVKYTNELLRDAEPITLRTAEGHENAPKRGKCTIL